MKKIFCGLFVILMFNIQLFAATVLQVKGNSAIVEISDAEMQNLQPASGQQIQLTSGSKRTAGIIKKVLNKKLLLTTKSSLDGQKVVRITSSGAASSTTASATMERPSAKSNSQSKKLLQKRWTLGANLKYVTGSANVTITSFPSQTLKYSGFAGSAVGLYYFGSFGIGAEGEYALMTGSTSIGKDNVTQLQMSLLGEYKFNSFAVGALFTFSNIKDTDNVGNDNSLNGTGFGAYAAYAVKPQVRILLEYRTVNYSLDPATYAASDIRLGAGYYF